MCNYPASENFGYVLSKVEFAITSPVCCPDKAAVFRSSMELQIGTKKSDVDQPMSICDSLALDPILSQRKFRDLSPEMS